MIDLVRHFPRRVCVCVKKAEVHPFFEDNDAFFGGDLCVSCRTPGFIVTTLLNCQTLRTKEHDSQFSHVAANVGVLLRFDGCRSHALRSAHGVEP